VARTAIIIGSGIAGIASAIRLRHAGYYVKVFEASDKAGGKMGVISDKGYRWDTGPSLFTMPHFVDELFSLYGENPSDWLEYSYNETLCHYFWDDGSFFKADSDKSEFIKAASNYFSTDHNILSDYLESAERKYNLTAPVFLEKSLHKLSSYLTWDTIKAISQIAKLHIGMNLDTLNRSYFKNEKLRQLFNRYATYNGSSPYMTPGIMSIIPHLEMHFGSFSPKGGMYAVAKSLYQFACAKGVDFSFNDPVTDIIHQDDKIKGVHASSGKFQADIVVSNSDVWPSYNKLLKGVKKPRRVLDQERSSSALIFYLGIKKSFDQLDLHNIFFSSDYQAEFDHIFNEKSISDDPTIYINITKKKEIGDAPQGCENWFVMVNAPSNEGQNWDEIRQKTRKAILQKLSNILGENIESLIEAEHVWDPPGIESKTGSYKGALYGSSSNSKFAAFLRHPNFSRQLKGLYFCGGSVHPGGGIPLCLLSAKIVNDLIQAA